MEAMLFFGLMPQTSYEVFALRADWDVTSRHGFLSKRRTVTSNVIFGRTRNWGWCSIKMEPFHL